MKKNKHFFIGDILSFRNSIVIFKEFNNEGDKFKCVASYGTYNGLLMGDTNEYCTKLYSTCTDKRYHLIKKAILDLGMRYQDGKIVSIRPDTYMHYIDQFGDYVIVRKDDGRNGISVRNGLVKRLTDKSYIQFAKGALLSISNYNCEITLDAFNLWIKMAGYEYDNKINKFTKL